MTALLAALAVLLVAVPARAVDVTSCQTAVPDYEVGELVQDLDCTTETRPVIGPGDEVWGPSGVILGNGSTLRLNGYTLRGPSTESSPGLYWGQGVACWGRRCTIVGPGTIQDAAVGIAASGARADIDGSLGVVMVQGCRYDGIRAQRDYAYRWGEIRGTGIRAEDNGGFGMITNGLKATDVQAHRNGLTGIRALRAQLTSVATSDNTGAGLVVDALRAVGVTTTSNGTDGVWSDRRAKITAMVASGNGFGGVVARKVTLIDSTVTGNNNSYDVSSLLRPAFANTTCGRSCQRVGDNLCAGTWGVCAGD